MTSVLQTAVPGAFHNPPAIKPLRQKRYLDDPSSIVGMIPCILVDTTYTNESSASRMQLAAYMHFLPFPLPLGLSVSEAHGQQEAHTSTSMHTSFENDTGKCSC
jgi:hypothetical protein